MNTDAVRQIADAILYEGYLLYPYRASAVKNQSRWQFGVLMPPDFVRADPSERSAAQAECVVEGADATFCVVLRFLQIQQRTGPGPAAADQPTAWAEGVERELTFDVPALPYESSFQLDAAVDSETVDGGRVLRSRRAVRGVVSVSAEPVPGPWGARRLRVRVQNHSDLPAPGDPSVPASGAVFQDALHVPAGPLAGLPPIDRAGALPSALAATHLVLGVRNGVFLSMVDPPEWAADAVAGCVNDGLWPVLAGDPAQRDLMLCSPIILYDHPRIAAESTGDMFDGLEIDEILTLRTRALTDDEKREARATDRRAAAVIDRLDALDGDQLLGLHGAIRQAPAEPESVLVNGREVRAGSRVVLRPGARRTDAQDMFLAGQLAQVEAVLRDLEDTPYLAVTLVDDPGADLSRSHGRFRYFAPDEVEPS